jgi:hypothetical protein
VPLFRFFNTNTGAHFFTTNVAERDMVLQRWPFFAYEGTAYQVYSSRRRHRQQHAPGHQADRLAVDRPAVPAIVTLSADATDVDGSISRVEYYLGADKIGETIFAPHTMNYAVLAAGNYAFRAIAYDNLGAPGPSPTVNVVAGTDADQHGAEGVAGGHPGVDDDRRADHADGDRVRRRRHDRERQVLRRLDPARDGHRGAVHLRLQLDDREDLPVPCGRDRQPRHASPSPRCRSRSGS